MESKRLSIGLLSMIVLLLFVIVGVVSAQEDAEAPQPFLGINFDQADNGVVVTNVAQGTPADEGGLQGDDVITMVDDVAVTADNFVAVILSYTVGDEVTLIVERDDEMLELSVTLGERPERAIRNNPEVEVISRAFLGIALEETDAGLEVVQVAPESPAEESGVQVGDILTAVDGESVGSVRDVLSIIRVLDAGDEITLTITRESEVQDIILTVDSVPFATNAVTIIGASSVVYLEDENAWEITELDDNSPLAEAGLQVGDRITAINGESPAPREIVRLVFEFLTSGEDVTLTVVRDQESLELDVSAQALISLIGRGFRGDFGGELDSNMPPIIIEPDGFQFGESRNFNNNRARLGVTYITLDEQTALEYESDVTEGAYVVDVEVDSPADQAGLQVDDIITAVDGDVVDMERTLTDRLYAYEVGDTITLTVLRAGETLDIQATLGARVERASLMPFFGEGVFSSPFDFDFPFDFSFETPFEIPFGQPESPGEL